MFSFWKRFYPLLKFPVILLGAFIFTKRLRNPPILIFEAYIWLRLMLCFRPRQWVRFAARQPAARCRWRYFKKTYRITFANTIFLLSVDSNGLWIFIINPYHSPTRCARHINPILHTVLLASHALTLKNLQGKIISLNHVLKIEWSPPSISADFVS